MKMFKQFIVPLFATLALVFTGVASAPIASAASATSSVSVAAEVKAPSIAKVIPETGLIGAGVNRPMWYTLDGYCYWGMDGGYYCYRYGCTNFEYWFYGCRDGYYRVNSYWYA
jgi:hypothetical protein